MMHQAKMIVQGLVATALHHALHGHLTNALRQEVKQVSSSSDESDDECDEEGKPSLHELAHDVKFFEDVCTKQKAQLKTFKK
jgi:hypothetical protein